jgi:hypothetical protein
LSITNTNMTIYTLQHTLFIIVIILNQIYYKQFPYTFFRLRYDWAN